MDEQPALLSLEGKVKNLVGLVWKLFNYLAKQRVLQGRVGESHNVLARGLVGLITQTMRVRKVCVLQIQFDRLLVHASDKSSNVLLGSCWVVWIHLALWLESLQTYSAALECDESPEIFSEDQSCVISTGQHQPNEEVVYWVSEALLDMGCRSIYLGSQVRGSKIDFLRIDINTLEILFQEYATQVCRHDLCHRGYF